ncbi:MAG TPA: hypothetical protein VES38_06745 [Methylotenera sp.]|nr:hypothetical protein [Methylotenera sp.]
MIIGIDPDIDKSGIACLHVDTKRIEMSCLTFVDIMKFIRMNQPIIKCVYIEAGWFNKKSSYHFAESLKVAACIGKKVGQNHAAGQLLTQCIEAEQIKVVLVKPTKSKLNAEQFKKLTKIQTRTNQEMRDSAMLVFGR